MYAGLASFSDVSFVKDGIVTRRLPTLFATSLMTGQTPNYHNDRTSFASTSMSAKVSFSSTLNSPAPTIWEQVLPLHLFRPTSNIQLISVGIFPRSLAV
jgi:hypothetical protein